MDEATKTFLTLVGGLGLVAGGAFVLCCGVLLMLAMGQLFVGLFGYVLPNMGLKLMRDVRSGDLPFTQFMDEMMHPPKATPILNAGKEETGYYEDRPRSTSRDLRVR